MTVTNAFELSNGVNLDSSGSGQTYLAPQVGQYWILLSVRVSTTSSKAPVPYCVIYHSPPGVPVSNHSFIDETYIGNNDVSSMVSGMVLQYGDSLVANWSQGNPGDNATLTIYGIICDSPPTVGELPRVPGTPFSGKLVNEAIRLLGAVDSSSFITLAGGSGLYIPTLANTDMRLFSSYYFSLDVVDTVPSPQPVQLDIDFASTQDFSGSVVHRTTYEFYAGTLGGPGSLFFQDIIHGPFWSANLVNNSANNVHVSYTLFGTTRQLLGPTVGSQNVPNTGPGASFAETDGVIMNYLNQPIPVAATMTLVGSLAYGSARFLFRTSGGAATFQFDYGTVSAPPEIYSVPAGTQLVVNTILPKRTVTITVVGNPGVLVSVFAVADYERS